LNRPLKKQKIHTSITAAVYTTLTRPIAEKKQTPISHFPGKGYRRFGDRVSSGPAFEQELIVFTCWPMGTATT
jgi:hypothetical protein